MADRPDDRTAPARPGAVVGGERSPGGLGTAATLPDDDALARARPALPSLELDVAQARVAEALFGAAEAVKIGRYRVIERAGAGGMGVVWSAWDPELGRGVALKLASSGDDVARARARDEGRALARLSHPNVVPIYDVLEHDDRVYLVMELVKGQTLRAAAASLPPARLVRAYREAGAGLAAAHDAGLVHRDFKPDNAILGADGRVRVLDFGLAHAVTTRGDESPTIAGTPRYMAPEQRAGQQLTAAVDQYALCVSLRESLTAAGGVPRWLGPILARGTAERPGERYPSMAALLQALALDPATRWKRRLAIGAGVLAVAGTVGGFTLGRARSGETPCTGGPGLVASAWGPSRRSAIAARLQALPTPFAGQSVPAVLTTVDRYRDAWLALHQGSCRAHRRGELTSALFDRRTACLARRRASLDAIAERAGATTALELAGLVEAASQLPAIADCADDDALAAAIAPPTAMVAPAVGAIDAQLARVDVDRDAGRLDEARRGADAAVGAARAVAYPPVLARALLARGRVALTEAVDDRGAADFTEALRAGLVVGDEPLALEAFARRVWARATSATDEERRDPTDGLELVEAMLTRLGARVAFAHALLDLNLGTVAQSRGDRAGARTSFERARRTAATVTGAGALELTTIDVGLLAVIDDEADRRAVGNELVSTLSLRLGPLHPRTLHARILVGTIGDASDDALRDLDDACARMIEFHPDSGAVIGECGYESLWNALARNDRSRVAIAEAVLAARDHGADENPVTLARAYRALVDGTPEAATATLHRLGEPGATVWWGRFYAADGLAAAAFVARAAGATRDAQTSARDALALYDSVAEAVPAAVLDRRRRALTTLAAPPR